MNKMPRPSIPQKNKNQIVSVSLLPQQVEFLNKNPDFSLSKYVQLQLQHFMDEYESFYSHINNEELKGGD